MGAKGVQTLCDKNIMFLRFMGVGGGGGDNLSVLLFDPNDLNDKQGFCYFIRFRNIFEFL